MFVAFISQEYVSHRESGKSECVDITSVYYASKLLSNQYVYIDQSM